MTLKDYYNFILKVAPVHHKAMVEKGFWEKPEADQRTVLIISELIEGMEAIRSIPRKFADVKNFEERLEALNSSINFDYVPTKDQTQLANKHYSECFERYVKDTFQDELAGTFLRILDVSEGFKNSGSPKPLYETSAPKEYSTFVLEMIKFLLYWNFSDALSLLLAYCNEKEIDLEYFVERAMLYNCTRQKKHGKNF